VCAFFASRVFFTITQNSPTASESRSKRFRAGRGFQGKKEFLDRSGNFTYNGGRFLMLAD
jgi:hypothetical protein